MTEQSTHTLELVKVADARTASYKGKEIDLPAWDVVLDGEVIGRVRKAMITRERRSPGKRYVNARWQSPGWRYYRPGMVSSNGLECQSRTHGVERILGDAGLGYLETRELAASVARVR